MLLEAEGEGQIHQTHQKEILQNMHATNVDISMSFTTDFNKHRIRYTNIINSIP